MPTLNDQQRGFLNLRSFILMNSCSAAFSAVGVGLWLWMIHHRDALPAVGTDASRQWLESYQATAHDAFLALLLITTIRLLTLSLRSRTTSNTTDSKAPQKLLQKAKQFASKEPLLVIIFTAYAVFLVQGTTWLYPEIVGWYTDVIDGELLNNFAFHQGFISETMRRTDYRLFPLAHQDLHILSWFTPYVQIWSIINAIELFATVLIASKITALLSGREDIQKYQTLSIVAILMLIHASTGEAFFQFIYSERVLTLTFGLYTLNYLRYKQTLRKHYFYSAWLFALIGIFVKDISIILFATPPAFSLILNLIRHRKSQESLLLKNKKEWLQSISIDCWLLSLIPIFICAYIYLSLLPSSFVSEGAYSKGNDLTFQADFRFYILIFVITFRALMAGLKRIRLDFIDGLNIAAIGYSLALFALVGLKSYSYLSLPITFVIVINIAYLWAATVAPRLRHNLNRPMVGIIGIGIAVLVVGLESLSSQSSFFKAVSRQKQRQESWLKTYRSIRKLSEPIKEKGENINIIYSEKSWLSADRHLNKINHDRLIEHDPIDDTYTIKQGINKGEQYHPKPGDLIVNIDADLSTLKPILDRFNHITLFRHSSSKDSGAIYRIQQSPLNNK